MNKHPDSHFILFLDIHDSERYVDPPISQEKHIECCIKLAQELKDILHEDVEHE